MDDNIEAKLIKRNEKHVEKHGKKHESEEAKKHVFVLTCMDARIQEADYGFKSGEAYFCRNGGGKVTDDAIRSAVLTIRLFAVDTIFIIQHTDCGLEKVSDPKVRELLRRNLGPAHLGEDVPKERGNRDVNHNSDYIAFLAFEDLRKSVIHDVFRMRSQPLISKKVGIFGYIYDVDTGELTKVEGASSPGSP